MSDESEERGGRDINFSFSAPANKIMFFWHCCVANSERIGANINVNNWSAKRRKSFLFLCT